jgi:hypothetical protein
VRILLGCIVALATILTPATPSLSGRWNVKMNPDFKGNRTVEDCVIDQTKQRVTVTCGGSGASMSGEVRGHRVSWQFEGRDGSKVVWFGNVNQDATTINGTWRFRFSDGNSRTGQFAAERRGVVR